MVILYCSTKDANQIKIFKKNNNLSREFLTRPDTNRPAQPHKLARVLKFRL